MGRGLNSSLIQKFSKNSLSKEILKRLWHYAYLNTGLTSFLMGLDRFRKWAF